MFSDTQSVQEEAKTDHLTTLVNNKDLRNCDYIMYTRKPVNTARTTGIKYAVKLKLIGNLEVDIDHQLSNALKAYFTVVRL